MDLRLTINYDPVPPVYKRGADTTLKLAGHVLRLLAALERGLDEKAPRIIWDVNIYSLDDRAVIEFSAVGDRKHGRTLLTKLQAIEGWDKIEGDDDGNG